MFRKVEAQGDLPGKVRVLDLDAESGEQGSQTVVESIVANDRTALPGGHFDSPRAVERQSGGGRIGPHQSAGPQQDPAEIACDDHRAVGDAAFLEKVENGRSRGARRFSVVAVAPRPGAQGKGKNIVTRVAVRRPALFDECGSLLFVGCRADRRDKTGTLLGVFADSFGFHGMKTIVQWETPP